MCGHRLLSMENPAWLSPSFQASLAHKKIALPQRNTIEAILSRRGNTPATWRYIFDNGFVTASQVIANFRSLVLLDFPAKDVRAFLIKRIESVSLSLVFKIDAFMSAGIFSDEGIASLVEKRDALLGKAGGEDGLVPVEMSMTFRDAKGATSAQNKVKNVAVTFSQETTISEYRKLGKYLLHALINAHAA